MSIVCVMIFMYNESLWRRSRFVQRGPLEVLRAGNVDVQFADRVAMIVSIIILHWSKDFQ